jgi:hypothetical protein
MVDASALFLKGCPTFAMSMASFRNFDLRKVRQTESARRLQLDFGRHS